MRRETGSRRPGRQMDISCMHWVLGKRREAIEIMRDLVKGVLDGSVRYGDAAGGVGQGLLLYYMGVTEHLPEEISFALDYMRNRASRMAIRSWPGPVARYYLGQIAFEGLVTAATGQPELPRAGEVASAQLFGRRRLCGALFHDGVRSRAHGDEEHCLIRMRECYGLENPLIEQEWYLARYEAQGGRFKGSERPRAP